MRCSLVLAILAMPHSLRGAQDNSKEIRALIERLRSVNVGERETATRKLIDFGEDAATDLKLALDDRDPEVARRARDILDALPHRFYRKFEASIEGAKSVILKCRFQISSQAAGGKFLNHGSYRLYLAPGNRVRLELREEAEPPQICLRDIALLSDGEHLKVIRGIDPPALTGVPKNLERGLRQALSGPGIAFWSFMTQDGDWRFPPEDIEPRGNVFDTEGMFEGERATQGPSTATGKSLCYGLRSVWANTRAKVTLVLDPVTFLPKSRSLEFNKGDTEYVLQETYLEAGLNQEMSPEAFRTDRWEGVAELVRAGSASIAQGRILDAMEDFTQAIKLDSFAHEALIGRGRARREAYNLSGAVADLTKALALDPANPTAFRERGVARCAMREYALALEDLTRAIELCPKNSSSWTERGIARTWAGEGNEAIGDFTTSYGLSSDRNPMALHGRAVAYKKGGDLEAARADFKKANDDAKGYVPALIQLGVMALERGAADEASGFLEAAHQEDSGEREALIWLWIAQCRMGKRAAISDRVERFLTKMEKEYEKGQSPRNDRLHEILRFLAGKVPEAVFLERMVHPESQIARTMRCQAYYYAGMRWQMDGHPEPARAHFRECLKTEAQDSLEYQMASVELKKR